MKVLKSVLTLLALMCMCAGFAAAQGDYVEKLKEGDIIFQKLPCGGLCDAIIATTPCKPGLAFNHCGIIHFEGDKPYVIEAIGKAVQQIPVAEFVKRDTERVIYIGRIGWLMTSNGYMMLRPAIDRAERYIGRPYDDAFLPGDKALYCSELVWECYRNHEGKPLFSLAPMTFKSPNTGATFPAWDAYYKELGVAVPEGVPGINPCAIANSDMVEMMEFRK